MRQSAHVYSVRRVYTTTPGSWDRWGEGVAPNLGHSWVQRGQSGWHTSKGAGLHMLKDSWQWWLVCDQMIPT